MDREDRSNERGESKQYPYDYMLLSPAAAKKWPCSYSPIVPNVVIVEDDRLLCSTCSPFILDRHRVYSKVACSSNVFLNCKAPSSQKKNQNPYRKAMLPYLMVSGTNLCLRPRYEMSSCVLSYDHFRVLELGQVIAR